MVARFEAQTLVRFGRTQAPPCIELTFENAKGERLTVSLPARVAADALAPILAQFAPETPGPPGAPAFHQIVNRWRVGHSNETPHVSIWLNDEPPLPDDAARRSAVLWPAARRDKARGAATAANEAVSPTR